MVATRWPCAGIRDRRRDLARDTAEKTASIHFLRFELDPEMRVVLRGGAGLGAGIDHGAYLHALEPIPSQIRDALLVDLD